MPGAGAEPCGCLNHAARRARSASAPSRGLAEPWEGFSMELTALSARTCARGPTAPPVWICGRGPISPLARGAASREPTAPSAWICGRGPTSLLARGAASREPTARQGQDGESARGAPRILAGVKGRHGPWTRVSCGRAGAMSWFRRRSWDERLWRPCLFADARSWDHRSGEPRDGRGSRSGRCHRRRHRARGIAVRPATPGAQDRCR